MTAAGEPQGDAPERWTLIDSVHLKIEARRGGQMLAALISGRIDGSNAREFQTALEGAIEEQDALVRLDLAGLSYISSAGLRVLLLTARMLQSRNTEFGVQSLPGPVLEVFQISGFDKLIPIHAPKPGD